MWCLATEGRKGICAIAYPEGTAQADAESAKSSGLDRDFTYGHIPLRVPKFDQLREGNCVHANALAEFEDAWEFDSYANVRGTSAVLRLLILIPYQANRALAGKSGGVSALG